MKTKILSIFLLSMSSTALPQKTTPDCKNAMKYANVTYHYQQEKAPRVKGEKDIIIHIDSIHGRKDFVSIEEDYMRKELLETDTTTMYHDAQWNMLTSDRKLAETEKNKAALQRLIDSMHVAHNSSRYFIWVVNHSGKKIEFPEQDGCPVMILEAQDGDKAWKPIQYWMFSGCGNSYGYDEFKPGYGLRMVTDIPTGNYKARLRCKVMGTGQFYYSAEFEASIDYCAFFDKEDDPYPLHYKLDMLPEGW